MYIPRCKRNRTIGTKLRYASSLRASSPQQAIRPAPATAIGTNNCRLPLCTGPMRVRVRVRVHVRVCAVEQFGRRRLSPRAALQGCRDRARDGWPVHSVEGGVAEVGVAPAALRLDLAVSVVRPTARGAHLGTRGYSLGTRGHTPGHTGPHAWAHDLATRLGT